MSRRRRPGTVAEFRKVVVCNGPNHVAALMLSFVYPTHGAVEEPNYDPSGKECSAGLHVTSNPAAWAPFCQHSHILRVMVKAEDVLSICGNGGFFYCPHHVYPDKARVKALKVINCMTCDGEANTTARIAVDWRKPDEKP